MITVGTPLICIESHPASCLIVGKTYYVASISGDIVQLDNNVWTYLSRFQNMEHKSVPDVSDKRKRD
jgi:hypothetical protein